MKKTLIASLAVVLTIAFVASASDKPWFDKDNCSFCQAFHAQPGLMEHMRTEYHNLHNGTMSIIQIDEAHEAAFSKAQESMQGVVKELQAGKTVPMCLHCSTLGSLMMQGVTPDAVRSGSSHITIYTSSDTTMVKKLQEFGQKSMDAIAAMHKAPK